MTPEESERLRRIEKDVRTIKNREYAGGFTAFAVFCMWLTFVMDGCSFQ